MKASALGGRRITKMTQEIIDAVVASLNRPIRTLLVLLAYILGVASLVGAMGVTQTTTGQISTRLTEAGSTILHVTDTVAITQPWTVDDPMGNIAWENAQAMAAQLSTIEGVENVTQVRTFTQVGNKVSRLRLLETGLNQDISLESNYKGRIMVTDERYFAAHKLTASSGKSDLLQNSWNGSLVVAGATAATFLDITEASPGVSIWVNDRLIDVAAVLKPSGDVLLDDTLFFSAGALPLLTDQLDNYWFVEAKDGYAEPLARAIPFVLSPDNPGRIGVTTVAQLAKLQEGINSDLAILLSAIGWVVLFLSALTAGTTMFLSVQQREPEIALRRAMGASRSSIWRLFTYEGVTIGVSGGIFGTAVGIGITWIIAQIYQWPLYVGFNVIITGTILGATAGVIASVIPALHAARRDPAGILRQV